jgi:hypothetical protein
MIFTPLAERSAADPRKPSLVPRVPRVVSPDPRYYLRAGLHRLGVPFPRYTRCFMQPRWEGRPAGLTGLSGNSGYTGAAFAARGRGGRSATAQDAAGTRGHPSQPRAATIPAESSRSGPNVPGQLTPDGATGARPTRRFAGAAGRIGEEPFTPVMPIKSAALSTWLSRCATPGLPEPRSSSPRKAPYSGSSRGLTCLTTRQRPAGGGLP